MKSSLGQFSPMTTSGSAYDQAAMAVPMRFCASTCAMYVIATAAAASLQGRRLRSA
jgi:hypothetical protein